MKHLGGGVGLQLRLGSSLTELAHKALRLELDSFQCFLTVQETGRSFVLKKEDQKNFMVLREEHFGSLFLHGSYLSNLADPSHDIHPRLEHEIRIAEELAFTHLILHAGAYPFGCLREDGHAAVARVINRILARTHKLIIVLENVAHGKRVLGGELEDFSAILARIDKPERVEFCLDTAHAHSFGYDLVSTVGRTQLLDEFDRLCGHERLALVHLNDTIRECGDRVDQHCVLGEGILGSQALPALCVEPRLAEVPFVLEMPELSEHDELSLVKQVESWRNVAHNKFPLSREILDSIR